MAILLNLVKSGEFIVIHLFVANIPYSRRGHDEQKARLGWQIYRKVARQYVTPEVTPLLLNVHVT